MSKMGRPRTISDAQLAEYLPATVAQLAEDTGMTLAGVRYRLKLFAVRHRFTTTGRHGGSQAAADIWTTNKNWCRNTKRPCWEHPRDK